MFSLSLKGLHSSIIGAIVAAAVLAVLGGILWQRAADPGGRPGEARSKLAELAALPKPEPQQVKPLTPEQAKAANDALPFAENGLEPAPAFRGADGQADPLAYTAALDCLTAAVYYEAASESAQGQRAVAQVVLNRVRHPAFPPRICDVVHQGSERRTGCQFTFTCDGSLARQPSRAGWQRARQVAERALAGAVEPSVGMATHYHANWVAPYWAPELDKVSAIGAHIFYRWKGYWGLRPAFSQHYGGEAGPMLAELAGEAVPTGSGDEAALDLAALQAPLAHLRATLDQPRSPILVADEPQRRLLADDASPKLIADESAFGAAAASPSAP